MDKALLDNHPNPYFVISGKDETLLWLNSKAEVLLARSSAGLRGEKFDKTAKGLDSLSTNIEICIRNETIIRGQDLALENRLGESHLCQYLIYPSGGNAVIMLSPQEDQHNDDISESQSVTMLGRMLAHELKNPLAGIHGAAQLLGSSLSGAEDKELTDLIMAEAGRIGRLADRMETFAAHDESTHVHFNVHEVLRKAKLLFESQKDTALCDIIENYDPSLPDVFANEDALMQVIVNLIANAREAIVQSGKSGTIELKTSYKAGVTKQLKNGQLQKLPIEVLVIDSGPGIPSKIRNSIFQPFVTAKANGQGLGLALVSKIIEDHNGQVSLKIKSKKTIFSLLLPMNKAE